MSLINLVGGLVTPSYPTLYIVHSSVMDEARDRGSIFDGVVGSLNEVPVPEIRGTEFISANFTSSASEGHTGLVTEDVRAASAIHFESPASPRPNLTSIGIMPSDDNDPYAPCVFIPSCPYFQRQKSHAYQITRSSPRKTPSGSGHLNGDFERDNVLENFGPSQQATVLVSALSIAIIGGMTGFHAQNSSLMQRIAIMLWVTVGIYVGTFLTYMSKLFPVMGQFTLWWLYLFVELPLRGILKTFKSDHEAIPIHLIEIGIRKVKHIREKGGKLMLQGVYCAPSLFRFVVVGLMIKEFGVCPQ
jgi:hypothetical protein